MDTRGVVILLPTVKYNGNGNETRKQSARERAAHRRG